MKRFDRMSVGKKKRLRCPSCGSLRVEGSLKNFKCKKCGFKHQENKPEPRLIMPSILTEANATK